MIGTKVLGEHFNPKTIGKKAVTIKKYLSYYLLFIICSALQMLTQVVSLIQVTRAAGGGRGALPTLSPRGLSRVTHPTGSTVAAGFWKAGSSLTPVSALTASWIFPSIMDMQTVIFFSLCFHLVTSVSS